MRQPSWGCTYIYLGSSPFVMPQRARVEKAAKLEVLPSLEYALPYTVPSMPALEAAVPVCTLKQQCARDLPCHAGL